MVLTEIGLTDAAWAPLVHLEESGDGISQKELAWRVGIEGSTLVRLLDILDERGFVERRTDRNDRRTKNIFLTDAGRATIIDIRRAVHGAEELLLADLNDSEIAAALTIFDKIRQRLANIQGQRRSAP